jgi:hypothetical protein
MAKADESNHLSRPQAIERIREKLMSHTDGEHCACAVAGQLNVFCGGFRALSDKEFRTRFSWISSKRPRASRRELEEVVSLYHLGRQEAEQAALCCDVETREHCACDGWNRFDNPAVERFVYELTGASVHIG